MRSSRVMFFGLTLAVAGILLPVNTYASDFRLRVEDLTVAGSPNGYGVVLTDQGAGDENPLEGLVQVTLNPLDSNVTWNLTMGMSKPLIPLGGALGELFLQSFNITSSGAATIRVTLQDTGFVGMGSSVPLLLTSSVFGTFCAPDPDPSKPNPCAAGSPVTFSTTSWGSSSNAVPSLGADQVTPAALSAIGANAGTATSPLTTSSSGVAPSDFSGVTYAAFEDSGPTYSMFTQLLIQFAGAGSVDFYQDVTMTVDSQHLTPEPGSLMLIGTGLMGFVMRRRYLMNA